MLHDLATMLIMYYCSYSQKENNQWCNETSTTKKAHSFLTIAV